VLKSRGKDTRKTLKKDGEMGTLLDLIRSLNIEGSPLKLFRNIKAVSDKF
jgi:hypothetical protein